MDAKQQEAIRLKYEGVKYAEIAKTLNISENTLWAWFGKDGLLELEYEQYAREQGKKKLSIALDVFKKHSSLAADAMNKVLRNAIRNVEKAQQELDEHLKQTNPAKTTTEELERKVKSAENRLFELSERVLDRAGLTVVNRTEVKKGEESDGDSKQLTDEQLKRELQQRGINPNSISYQGAGRPTAES